MKYLTIPNETPVHGRINSALKNMVCSATSVSRSHSQLDTGFAGIVPIDEARRVSNNFFIVSASKQVT